MGFSWENHGKTWKKHGKNMEKPWKTHGKHGVLMEGSMGFTGKNRNMFVMGNQKNGMLKWDKFTIFFFVEFINHYDNGAMS
jgi:hypothetical protein